MKKLLIACLCCIGIVFVAIGAGAKEEWTAPDDDLVIDFIKPDKGIGVVFNHSSHEGYECIDCHHNIKKSGKPTSCASKGCHDNFSAMPVKGYKSYFKAMHYKRNNTKRPSCLGCHVKEFGNDKEMTGCVNSACHPEGIK